MGRLLETSDIRLYMGRLFGTLDIKLYIGRLFGSSNYMYYLNIKQLSKMKGFLLVFVFGISIHIAFPQSFDKAKLDSYLGALEMNNKFMGSVAISQNGKIIYTKQVGFADVEGKVKPDAGTKYRIGSISKTFTTI